MRPPCPQGVIEIYFVNREVCPWREGLFLGFADFFHNAFCKVVEIALFHAGAMAAEEVNDIFASLCSGLRGCEKSSGCAYYCTAKSGENYVNGFHFREF